MTARIVAVQFLGSFTRMTLALPGDDAARADCDVAAGALGDLAAKEGADLPIALPRGALRVFTDGRAAGDG
jgi:hypothetical protein